MKTDTPQFVQSPPPHTSFKTPKSVEKPVQKRPPNGKRAKSSAKSEETKKLAKPKKPKKGKSSKPEEEYLKQTMRPNHQIPETARRK